jgi:hypothetical protein
MKKLYLLENKFGKYYCLADNVLQATEYLESNLEKSDYGFSDDRKVVSIDIIAEEIEQFPRGKLNFGDYRKNLLIAEPNPQ